MTAAGPVRTAVLFVLVCCFNCFGAGSQQKAITLALPRAPGPGEAIRVRVSAGVLPAGARIIVRTATGKIAGTVAPYGIPAGAKAGAYTIPIPAEAAQDGKLSLFFELKDKHGYVRAPTSDELGGAELVLVPVSKNEDKK